MSCGPESRPIGEILAASLDGEWVDVLIGGDTHVERLEYRDDVLLINPGSPSLPHHLSTQVGRDGDADGNAASVGGGDRGA